MTYQATSIQTSAKAKSKTAAAHLQVAESTLRKSRVTGTLCGLPAPAYTKMGRTVLYDIADLDAWLEQLPKGNSTSNLVA